MGWASYFEDISQKYEDSFGEPAFLPGPAGNPGIKIKPPAGIQAGGRVQTKKIEIPQSLVTCYEKLANTFEIFAPPLLQAYVREDWKSLSHEMDRLEGEALSLGRKVLFSAIDKRNSVMGELLANIRRVLSLARAIVERHDVGVRSIADAYSVFKAELRLYGRQVPASGERSGNQIDRLLLGWRELRQQCEVLSDRAEHLEESVELKAAEDLMPRLIDGLQHITPKS